MLYKLRTRVALPLDFIPKILFHVFFFAILLFSLYFSKVNNMTTIEDNPIWQKDTTCQLSTVLSVLDDEKSIQNFLSDVMTEKEIIEISSRLEAAKMLSQNQKYPEVIKQTGLSSRTVARISSWLKNGCGGYETALLAINHQKHM